MSGVGVAVPPDEYLPEVESLCRKYGILLHVDEVINGFGRTGKMFAHQHYGVSPDIIAIAKGISSAYLPIAATVVKNRVFDSFYGDPAENRQVAQVNTYGGHPVAAAVALRNIEIMRGRTAGRALGGDGRLSARWAAQLDAPQDRRRRARQGPAARRRTGEGPRPPRSRSARRRSPPSSISAGTTACSSVAAAAGGATATRSRCRRRW